ncbi:MAG TPA: DUF2155 domain-containing protein [Magnetospirillaceae bacterium]|nr:DUF2155 domain-containing protein [Magnetospirillaceae bacterium]
MRLARLLPLLTLFCAAQAGAADLVFDKAILQGMDKVSGRIVKFEAPVGQSVRFGTLEIIVRTCRKHPPEDPPESAAFIDIWEIKTGEAAASLFRGWMFASSPALSALEHPVYDIWVADCADPVARPETQALPPPNPNPAPEPKPQP